MPQVSLRDALVVLIAALAMAATIAACQRVAQVELPAALVRADSGIETLPARPAEAPLLVAAQPTLPADDARARNAAVAFFAGKLAAARPFRFSGSAADFANARDCLALAAMAEAGPSDPGQRAVMQVVLNRVRHPAFARTVCGVVFEGSDRASGCQFTFTCDGSLARRHGNGAWAAARARAGAMLKGAVYAPVGNATHYHTDWVFPWWSPKLVKLARVETHLFFRWPGYWGSPAAGRLGYRGGEPAFAALVANAEQQGDLAAAEVAPMPELPADTPKVGGGNVTMRVASGKATFVEILPGTSAAGALIMAKLLCNAPGTCRVMGWRDRAAIPGAFPLPPAARASLAFSFTRDPAGAEIVLYDCRAFPGLPREKCIPKAR